MVVAEEGEILVKYWGVWKGTLTTNGKTYKTPVLNIAKFVDEKIEKFYWDWDISPQ